jgi:hypothetical protein
MQQRTPQPPSLKQRVVDAEFLADEFEMPARKAADLVARPGSDGEAIKAEVHERQLAEDPLKGMPTPQEPAVEHEEDTDEVRLKPVLHERNDHSGAG